MADQGEPSLPSNVAIPKFDNLRFSRAMLVRHSFFDPTLSDAGKDGIVASLDQNNDILLQALSRPESYEQALGFLSELTIPNDNFPALNRYTNQFLERNLAQLEAIVGSSDNYTHKDKILDFMLQLSRSGKQEYEALLMSSLQRLLAKETLAMPSFEGQTEEANNYRSYLGSFRKVYSQGTDKQIRETTRLLVSAWDSCATPEQKCHTAQIVARMIGSYGNLADQASLELAAYILKDYGLDYGELSRIWGGYSFNASATSTASENIWIIADLERQRPNIAKTLHEQFNISLFQRYPQEMLIEQFDQRDNTVMPYGVMVSAINDDAEVFQSVGPQIFMGMMHSELLKLGYTLRVCEAGTEDKLKEAFEGYSKRYGIKSASFGVIMGHGSPERIVMNWEHPRYPNRVIRKQSFQGGAPWKFSAFMKAESTLVLVSCSTGAENGIAQEISKQGLIVIGPDREANILGISIEKNADGMPVFRIPYLHAKTNTYKNGLLIN